MKDCCGVVAQRLSEIADERALLLIQERDAALEVLRRLVAALPRCNWATAVRGDGGFERCQATATTIYLSRIPRCSEHLWDSGETPEPAPWADPVREALALLEGQKP